MSRQLKEDLEAIYGGMITESTEKMTVGTVKPGELEGATKKTGPKKSGPEATDADKPAEAPESLQGDTVEQSKKSSNKGKSKFEELYTQVVKEELDEGGIESPSFDDAAGDFPSSGGEEDEAERLGDEELEGGETLADLFSQFGEIVTKIGELYAAEEGGVEEGELIGDEMGPGEGEEIPMEAIESTPAPEAVGTLTSKGNMKTSFTKVVKKEVSSKSAGQENGGKPKKGKPTTLGPKISLKANGSGAAVDGKNVSAFE